MTKKPYIGFFILTIFMIFFPVSEYIYNNESNNILLSFIMCQFAALLLGFIIFKVVFESKIKKQESYIEGQDAQNISKVFFYLTIVFFVLFISFYIQNVNGMNQIVIFAEKYRNGFYKGSGIYTLGITQIATFFVVFLIVKLKELNRYFFSMLLIVFIVASLLGLRIYLMPIYLFLLIRILSKKLSITSILSIAVLVVLFFGFKLVLAEELSRSAVMKIVMHILGRSDYSSLIYNGAYTLEANEALGFLPFFGIDVDQFKEIFVSYIPNLIHNKPNIGLFTGIALPLPLILFNAFSWSSLNFVILMILLFLTSLQKANQTDNMTSGTINIFLVYFSFSVLTEDILMFYKWPLIFITLTVTIVTVHLCKKKYKII
jgi:hypothetical protein